MARRKIISGWPLISCVSAAPSLAASAPVTCPSATSMWWVPLASALIGVVAALATPFVKDVFIQAQNDRRAKLASQREIFRNYAAPLTASSEKLIWRFREIFIENRHQFLKTATLPLVYNEYKRKSTLYRMATLLGWVRAIHLELSALPRGASGLLTPISKAIGAVQSALADGPHVELHRLEQLCAVWRIEIPENVKNNLATKIEVKLYELAGEKLKHESDYTRHLSHEEKTRLCQALATFLCQELGRAKPDDRVIEETVNQAITAMLYREALIYRDWQDAIGDAMLENDPDSIRKFKIIGYKKFEDILSGDTLWMGAFRDIINDIDFEYVNPNDFRAKQLKDLSRAVSNLLISLSGTEERDLVDTSALESATRLAALT
jgi:hypothetical protein